MRSVTVTFDGSKYVLAFRRDGKLTLAAGPLHRHAAERLVPEQVLLDAAEQRGVPLEVMLDTQS